MFIPREFHTATLLSNGWVLVVGGFGPTGVAPGAELYNPATGKWLGTNSPSTGRYGHTASLLANGKVLVAGGDSGSAILNSAELYDPAIGTWSSTGAMNNGRLWHTATLLPSGKVLVCGGDGLRPSTAELYDPNAGTWMVTGSMTVMLEHHTATLLPNGRVLVAGGRDTIGDNAIFGAEVFDPATGVWTAINPLNDGRYQHTATLLANGRLLVAGGDGAFVPLLSSVELYDAGLGFDSASQPQIVSFTSPLVLTANLTVTGSGFRGVSEGAGGNSFQDSPADYPLLQLRSVESGQVAFIPPTPGSNWSATALSSGPVTNFPPGWALATVFVNGIPSSSALLRVDSTAPLPIILGGEKKLANGSFQFGFTNTPALGFTVLASGDVALPLTSWTAIGSAAELSPGVFNYTDLQATNFPHRFYRVRSP